MFQRTINSLYQTQECTRPKPRRLLNSERDTKEVYFEHVPAPSFPPKEDHKKPAIPVTLSTVETELAPVTESVAVSALTPKTMPIELEDEGVKARDIVTTIVSRVLKKTTSDVDGTKSIKDLAGGMSTVH
jgi:fatty acid synthase subunit alpha